MSSQDQWIEIPATIFQQEGVIWVRESVETDQLDVMYDLLEGVYTKPFILDTGRVRSLHFDFSAVQSEMLVDKPNSLTFAYTQKMMAFLLFNPQPKHIAIIGLGGGSLTKFCYQQLPRTRVTTLEINEHVMGLSELFEIPPPDKFKRIIHADAAEYFAKTTDLFDVVLIDGCDRTGTAPIFFETAFLNDVKTRLQPQGMLVMNLTRTNDNLHEVIQTVEHSFSTQALVLNVNESRNKILFAFNSSRTIGNWRDIRSNAKKLATQHGLDFPYFARRLQREGLSENHHG